MEALTWRGEGGVPCLLQGKAGGGSVARGRAEILDCAGAGRGGSRAGYGCAEIRSGPLGIHSQRGEIHGGISANI